MKKRLTSFVSGISDRDPRSVMAAFRRDESGATAVELGVIATVMGMMLITALGAINKEMKENYNAIQTAVEDVR